MGRSEDHISDIPLDRKEYFSSMGSVLEARLRRETRKSRLLIRNARQSLDGYNQQKLVSRTEPHKVLLTMVNSKDENLLIDVFS